MYVVLWKSNLWENRCTFWRSLTTFQEWRLLIFWNTNLKWTKGSVVLSHSECDKTTDQIRILHHYPDEGAQLHLPFDARRVVERQTGDEVGHLRSDNGVEYGSVASGDSLKERGVLFEKTEPYTPQQNGIAERTNGILMNKARSMMQCMEVEPKFWADAIATSVHLLNNTPSSVL